MNMLSERIANQTEIVHMYGIRNMENFTLLRLINASSLHKHILFAGSRLILRQTSSVPIHV